jgi:hypothetical protein
MTADLLWFDNKKGSMAEKITDAIVYYEKKYEQPAMVVRVSARDHTSLGDAEFFSTIDLQPVIVVWSSKVPKSHMTISCYGLTGER